MLPYISVPFIYVGDKIGASPDELKLIFSFILSYPLAGLLKRVPDARPAYKNLFIIGVGLFYLIGLFDLWTGIRTLFISSAGTYAISYFLRGSPYMPWVGFVFLMGHMSVNQLIRQFADAPSVVDITGAQMVLVMKLSAFCWNVADGLLPDEQLDDFQRDRVLRELPGLLDYTGYVLFFPSLLAGPAFDYAEYRRWLDCSMFDIPAAVDPTKKPPTRRKRKIPRSATPALWKLASGLFWIVAFLQLSNYYWPQVLLERSYVTHYGFLRRVLIMHMVGFTARTKYYGVWSMAEGACILAGLGYNGVDPTTGKVSWNRAQNINPWAVETAQSSRDYLSGWNMKTNSWLRNYIYLRVTPRGKKPGFRASMATFVTSAFWHGFYPGYYFTFMLGSLVQTVAKNCRRHIRPFFLHPATQAPLPTKRYYDIASWLATQLTFSFVVTPFVLLSASDSLSAWFAVYLYGIVAVGGCMAAFSAPPVKAALRKAHADRAAKAGFVPKDGGKGRPGGTMSRTNSTDSVREPPTLGFSSDPEKEMREAANEIRGEVQRRKSTRDAKKK